MTLPTEHDLLDRRDIGVHPVGDGEVAVADLVGDGVQHRGRAEGQTLGVRLQATAQFRQFGVLAVAHGQYEVRPGEDHDLAGLDDLTRLGHRLVLDVLHGAQDEELGVVVDLELRPLVCVYRVFDDEFVEAERGADVGHLSVVGGVESDPYEALAGGPHPGETLGVAHPSRLPVAVDVHRAIDDRPRHGDADLGERAALATR